MGCGHFFPVQYGRKSLIRAKETNTKDYVIVNLRNLDIHYENDLRMMFSKILRKSSSTFMYMALESTILEADILDLVTRTGARRVMREQLRRLSKLCVVPLTITDAYITFVDIVLANIEFNGFDYSTIYNVFIRDLPLVNSIKTRKLMLQEHVRILMRKTGYSELIIRMFLILLVSMELTRGDMKVCRYR